jgi:hypothetical protein
MKECMSSRVRLALTSVFMLSFVLFFAESCKKTGSEEEIPVFNQDWNKPMPEVDQDIPVVYITTENNAAITSKEEYVRGHVTISDLKGRYSDVKKLESPMKIRGRGNSTWKYDKKPYRIKLDEKQKVLGMDKNKDWVLLANYCDKSLLRNIVAMEISRKLEFAWTIDMIPVEVYLNDEYLGVYNICQHKEVANHRVDIAEDELLFELDKNMDEPVHFRSSVCKIPVNFSHPEQPADDVIKSAKQYFTDFETVLYGDNFTSPANGYAKYIDVDSFIRYYIIQELSYNIDGKCCKSTFLTKQKDKKLEMYFVWDFDLAFGNCNYFGNYYNLDNGPTGFHTRDYLSDYTSGGVNYGNYGKGWYYRLFQDPAFVDKVQKKWNEIYPFLRTIPDLIDDHVEAIGEDPIKRNFDKWKILGKYIWPQTKPYPDTHAGEVEKLKEFYTARLNWLNSELNKL